MLNLRGKSVLLILSAALLMVTIPAWADEVTTENTETTTDTETENGIETEKATESESETETEEPGVIRADDDVVFYFNVEELPTPELLKEYDFSLELIRDVQDKSYAGVKFHKDAFVLGVHFEETGRVPALAKIEIPVGIKYAGQKLYYCEITKNGELEYKGIYGNVDNNGIFTVNYNHRFDSMLMTQMPVEAEDEGGFKIQIDTTFIIILVAALINLAIYMTNKKTKKG